jgi:hypothetical protein
MCRDIMLSRAITRGPAALPSRRYILLKRPANQLGQHDTLGIRFALFRREPFNITKTWFRIRVGYPTIKEVLICTP